MEKIIASGQFSSLFPQTWKYVEPYVHVVYKRSAPDVEINLIAEPDKALAGFSAVGEIYLNLCYLLDSKIIDENKILNTLQNRCVLW